MDVNDSPPFWHEKTVKPSKTVKDPIPLFGQFVSAVSSDALHGIQSRSDFSIFVRDLCVKEPSVAQYLVQEILKHSNGSEPEVQSSKENWSSTGLKNTLRTRKRLDPTYRGPKSSWIQADIHRHVSEDADGASDSFSLANDSSAMHQTGHDGMTIRQSSESLIIKESIPECEGGLPEIFVENIFQEGVQASAHGPPISTISSESVMHQLKAMYSSGTATRNAVRIVVPDESTQDGRTIRPSSPSEVEQQETALPEIDGEASGNQAAPTPFSPCEIVPQETTLPESALFTPVQQVGRGFQSPISEDQSATPHTVLFSPIGNGEVLSPLTEDGRSASSLDKVETTLLERALASPSRTGPQHAYNAAPTRAQEFKEERILVTDNHTMVSISPPREVPTLTEMIAKAVHLIYEMSNCQEIPTEVHSSILSTLRPGLGKTTNLTSMAERSGSVWITNSPTTWSASMWINMLEAGHTRSKKVTILNMVVWMGASEWYDNELEQAGKVQILTKRGTPRKRLATVVLDKYLKEAADTPAVTSPGKAASDDNKDPSPNPAGIQKRIFDNRRKRLNNIFHRGRTLCKLVQMTHLGILFNPDIWEYAKASKESLDKIAAPFQADPQKMDLLSVLDEQVELLAKEGRPDLSRLFDSLESHSILPSEEILQLRAEYGGERDLLLQSCLDTAITGVVKGIGHVLGKHTLGDDDTIMVNGTVELSCGIFDRLCSRGWLNCWDIAAVLEMTDRPVFMRLGHSVPLHKNDEYGGVTPNSNPLRRWRRKIDEYRCEGKNDLKAPQVYTCPLNINADHFTLLEINEQTKMIYHYNSMASSGIIHRKIKSTPVRRVVEDEFKYLNFGYIEAPTPQQRDGWSCGLMVIRNAKRRMIGLSVGGWNDELDPDRVTKEVIGDCETFLENDALQPLAKRRKKIVDQNVEPIRSSQRLRETTKGIQET
ncbi:hypothetical protein LARI1_G009016 [Lachnellula arida]|uniref:Ubiquitin-like protease family profile domain-containing protein n=1 Tax=Lachnellula arida TaxID=1316785 RepID=A0A8T9B6H2_9HELO|nr:hypothetical protein LARI1_G009016 [Lachnellula arida]